MHSDGVFAATESLQRKLSWEPTDDQTFRVAQAQKHSSPTTSDRTQSPRTAKRICTKCEGVLSGQFGPQCLVTGAYARPGSPDQVLACYGCGVRSPASLYHVLTLEQLRHLLWVALTAAKEKYPSILDRNGNKEAATSGGEDVTDADVSRHQPKFKEPVNESGGCAKRSETRSERGR